MLVVKRTITVEHRSMHIVENFTAFTVENFTALAAFGYIYLTVNIFFFMQHIYLQYCQVIYIFFLCYMLLTSLHCTCTYIASNFRGHFMVG